MYYVGIHYGKRFKKEVNKVIYKGIAAFVKAV